VVNTKTGQSIDYRWLLLESKKVPIPTPDEATKALKPRDKWRYIGTKTMPFVDAKDMVSGKAVYGADIDRPGMLTAMIERCPVANGGIKSFDAEAALKVPGVKFVTKVLPDGFPGGGVGMGFIPHAGVAVVAENTWAALQGRRALKVEWDLESAGAKLNRDYDSRAFREELEESTSKAGRMLRKKGDVEAAFAVGRVVDAGYHIPHLAQTPMEPPAAVAIYKDGSFEIWSPTQGPELAQHYVGMYLLEPDQRKWLLWQVVEPTEIAKETEREPQQAFNELVGKIMGGVDLAKLVELRDQFKKSIRDRVKVHVTLLGGGFGRKSKPDYAIEAAFLAKQYPGTPIRVQWTREDDIQFSFFNAVSSQYLKAALRADGHPTALLHRSAFTSFFATIFAGPLEGADPATNDTNAKARAAFHNGGEYLYGSGIEVAQGLEDMPFDIENIQIENCPAKSHIRVGWMRSVANIYHAFGICSFADEMAVAAGRDSKDYLLDLIGKGRVLPLEDEGVKSFDNNGLPAFRWEGTPKVLAPYPPDSRRLRAVVERVAAEAGWDEKVKQYKQMKGRGLGIAAHRSFLSYVAILIDVSLNDKKELTINEIHGAIDCGMAVNVDRCIAQMEGGILYGLSYALLGEITAKNGRVEQHNFDDYPVLRMHHTPKIFTYFVTPSAESIKDMGGELTPTGVGEPPTPAVAPALANAIFAASGIRIREIPFFRQVVVR
jgi:isoquinoline 1-oxidoreductase beta subunit